MNIRETVPEALLEKILDMFKKLTQQNSLKPFKAQRMTKYGKTLDVWINATLLVNKNGEPYAIATTERAI